MIAKIKVLNQDISTIKFNDEDYISLTDIANSKDGELRAADIIKNWIRNRGTLEFIGTWEQLYNSDFKVVEFDHFRMSAGLPSFVLSPGKWVENTNAIKENLIPKQVTSSQISFVYANEADILNIALFGQTAKEWRDLHPELKGNIRDYADVNQLVCLANLESLNAHLISEDVPQKERIKKLNKIAINQMNILLDDKNIKRLENLK